MVKSIFVFILAALFLFFEMAIQVSPGIMTSQLMSTLHIDIFWLGLMSGAYFITYTAMQIPAGLLYDKFNPKTVILIPLLICTVGGFLFALAPNVYLAASARIFMGFGSAFSFIGVLVVASQVFPTKYFTLIAGITQGLAALGAMCGTLPLVPMIHHFGWRETMAIVSSFGVILFILIFIFMNLPKQNKINGNQRQSLNGFLKVTKNPQSWVIAIYACLLWAPMAVVASLYGAPFIEKYFNMSISSSAFVILMMWVGIAIGSPIFGLLSDLMQKPRLWLMLTALLGLIAFGLLLFANVNSLVIIVILIFLAGAACAGQALSFSLVKRNNSDDTKATAIGFNNTAVVIAGFIFQPLVGFIISKHANNQSIYTGNNYYAGMLLIFACYVLAFIIALVFIKSSATKSH